MYQEFPPVVTDHARHPAVLRLGMYDAFLKSMEVGLIVGKMYDSHL